MMPLTSTLHVTKKGFPKTFRSVISLIYFKNDPNLIDSKYVPYVLSYDKSKRLQLKTKDLVSWKSVYLPNWTNKV